MKIKDILKVVNAKGITGDLNTEKYIKKFCIDSRKIRDGYLFVPLKGSRFDGHQFINDAVKKGASAFFTEKNVKQSEGIIVENSLDALVKIAKHKKDLLSVRIGITGTSGKTTTKKLLSFLLSDFFSTYSTEGNFNNEIGLPLTLSNIPQNAYTGILEMGAGKIGDISYLMEIAKPHIGVLTAVGHGHTEKFGSLENVIKGKGEIFEGVEVGILPFKLKKHYNLKKSVCFGTEEEADIKVVNIKITKDGTEGVLKAGKEDIKIFFPFYNRSIIYNLSACIGVMKSLELPVTDIPEKVMRFFPEEGRGNIIKHREFTIIDDSYNANPVSVENAVLTLSSIPAFRIIVLGDMLELGKHSADLHMQIGKLISASGIDTAIFYGKHMKYAYKEARKKVRSYFFENKDDVVKTVLKFSDRKPVILVKGSRGMKMEDIIHKILEV